MPALRFNRKMAMLQNHFKELPDILEQVILSEVEREKNVLTDYVREQLMAGKRDDYSDITPKYTEFTVLMKKFKGQISEWVTLYDEGDFHKSITLKRQNSRFIFDATDYKYSALNRKYSEKGAIVGISLSNLREFTSYYLLPVARKAMLPKNL